MTFYVYILQSQRNLSFYKGSTGDLKRRVTEHNNGKTISTKRYLPWVLVWFTQKSTKQEAVALELKLKNLSVDRTIDFITKYPPQVGLFEVHGVQR
jgi:putative endonuclease